MAWYSRTSGFANDPKKSVPEGIWTKCPACNETLSDPELLENLRVCLHCEHHLRMPTVERIAKIADEGSFEEHDIGLKSCDPLELSLIHI